MTVLDRPTDLTEGPLSIAMREGSQLEHRAAESAQFTTALLEGRVDESGYLDYLLRLRRIYGALETIGDQLAEDPLVAAVYDTALVRREALEADLGRWAELTGIDLANVVEPASPATDAYVERIAASTSWGGLYVAHHYTRYLGDLSGGQAIGRILAREFDLTAGEPGLAFYSFAQIDKPKPYKDGYRARLDALDLDSTEKGRIVDEVKLTFGLNQALFEELDKTLHEHLRVPGA